jgi:organic hydroperoxide reductase OsmC/OhrA
VSSEDARPIAQRLHADAHDRCFIARSVNFPVGCEPVVHVQTGN